MLVKEILSEYLQNVLPYEWEERTNLSWYGQFVAPDNSHIAFSTSQLSNGGWEISWLRNNVSTRIKTDPRLTNAILSTINKMIGEFVSRVKPETIYVALTANDPTKMSIYTRLLNKYGFVGHEITDDDEKEEKDLATEYQWWEFYQ